MPPTTNLSATTDPDGATSRPVEVPPTPEAVREPADLIEAELLVEDVSIDGMCGVY